MIHLSMVTVVKLCLLTCRHRGINIIYCMLINKIDLLEIDTKIALLLRIVINKGNSLKFLFKFSDDFRKIKSIGFDLISISIKITLYF